MKTTNTKEIVNILKSINISNSTSPSGYEVRNQFHISTKDATAFQSYGSLCAVSTENIMTLGRDWDYSATTLKWLYNQIRKNNYSFECKMREFGGLNKASIQKAIEYNKTLENPWLIYDPNMK